jgi:serine/threonine-protein kinase
VAHQPDNDRDAASFTRSAAELRVSSADDGRFVPGTILNQRYRISSRLGRGGMGDVYQAYDLTLGQNVALKFLPEGFVASDDARERLRQEVRLARQVSHPNVCRVYDIGDVDRAPFLSMEYVDGEDLASLLRRIGRLPTDKALDIARKLCAGLGAAHEKHVLHRDLKPANIMIDGRGEVIITDFGLAAVSGTVPAQRAREGTRAYMSPEQLAGREVTARSDLYALGLVLYEMFTGKRAFQSGSEDELARLQRDSTPASMTSVVKDLDPAVERVILRCLAHDPRQRPASAKLVALALPGGDPLAAALAAGETPSPDLVARAGDTQGLHPGVAAALFGGVIALLIFLAVWWGGAVLPRTPFDNSPEALAAIARQHLTRFGYGARPADSAYGIVTQFGFFTYARTHYSNDRIWANIAAARPAPVTFWYRESPIPLDPGTDHEEVGYNTPALASSGMLRLSTDFEGRLLSFEAIPAEHEVVAGAATPADWRVLFVAADLDRAQFQPADPEWTPLMAFDARAAWTGTWPNAPEIPIRIEAASWRGRPVSFRIIEPWTKASRDQTPRLVWDPTTVLVYFIGAPLAGVLAARNVRRKRADLTGALRLALAVLALDAVADALGMTHVAGASEFPRLFIFFAIDFAQAAVVAVLYLALEPYVRRRSPRLLVSWTRLLQGGVRDPVVGTHILVGSLMGLGVELAFQAEDWFYRLRGLAPMPPDVPSGALGARFVAGTILNHAYMTLFFAMGMLFFFFVLRVVLRRDWLAAIAWVATYVGLIYGTGPSIGDAWPEFVLIGAVFSILGVVLVRFGFLTMATAFVVGGLPVDCATLPLIPSRWYFGYSLVPILVTAAIAGYAFWISLGGRPLFSDDALS